MSSGFSVHTLGLIAITKLLSPSHAQQSVSLYDDYKFWMANNGLAYEGFRGFQANSSGRIAELAQEYLARCESTQTFADSVVDVNSNNLALGVSTFIQNDWFTCCSRVYSLVGQVMIFPMMELLGLDKKGKENCAKRSWTGVRSFFESKIEELDDMIVKRREQDMNSKEKQECAVFFRLLM